MAFEQALAVDLAQDRAAVEDVEEQVGHVRTAAGGADQEVSREVDAFEPQPGPPPTSR